MLEYFLQFMPNFLELAEHAETKKIRKSEAISALRDALRSTRNHIDLTRNFNIDENYDDIASENLANKWSNAANLIRPFDFEFASTLENKADYWVNPNGFRNDILNGTIHYDFRINLNIVIGRINELEKRLLR